MPWIFKAKCSDCGYKTEDLMDLPSGIYECSVRMWMRTRNEVHVQVRLEAGGELTPRELVCTVACADGQWKATGREPMQ